MLSKYRILKGDLRERGVCFLLPSDEAKTLSEIVSDGRWDKYDPIVSAIDEDGDYVLIDVRNGGNAVMATLQQAEQYAQFAKNLY
ncbi:hypothetical protein Hc94105_0264 [Helicobacter cinaedi]|uniref:hypothetical protein n=1 Tax=Helicobacter cinaedi TaxID=213 RepID=UPI001F40E325|nr:hypothetical protein [Helicobacter cinaedi]BDB66079.1 hypothetical protein Hc94105_0264 [Helicobacter cinaedi]